MDEKELENNIEEIKDDGKIHFPVFGLVVVSVLIVLMIICVVVILLTRGK